MINNRFELYKLKREIRRSGDTYLFRRKEVNEYGEKTGKTTSLGVAPGLYHETSSQVSETTSDSAIARTVKQPMILVNMEDFMRLRLVHGDTVKLHLEGSQETPKEFEFIKCIDIMNWGILADLAFREADSGSIV